MSWSIEGSNFPRYLSTMLRHSSIRNSFILIDPKSKKEIGQFKSAQKVFEYLGNCIMVGGKVYQNYGAFVKLLGAFDWRTNTQMDLNTCDKSTAYRLVFRKEVKMG